MPATAYIQRILLVVLLLLPARAAMATPALSGSDVLCNISGASKHHDIADAQAVKRHSNPQDAILLSTGVASSATGVQTGHAGGTGGFLAIYTGAAFWDSLHNKSNATELRRWRLLFSAVRHGMLQALYPAHGFW